MKSVHFSYIPRIDHLRFYALLLIIFFDFREGIALLPEHSYSIGNLLRLWIVNGNSGTSLFIVLSAFLFTLITYRQDQNIVYRKFIYNRILRIFPLTTVLVFTVITCSRATSTPMDIFRLLTMQLNTGNAATGWGNEYFPSALIWAIAVGFQFYLIFPFLILFTKKMGIRYLFGIILFFIIMKLVIVLTKGLSIPIYYNLYHTIIGRIGQFAIGILLGIFYLKNKTLLTLSKKQCSLGILIVLVLMTVLFYKSQNVATYFRAGFYFEIEALLYGLLIIFYLSFPESQSQSITGKVLAYLGSIGLSIYLLHLPLGIVIYKIFDIHYQNSLYQFFTYILLQLFFVIPICILFFNIFEKPFLLMRKNYLENNFEGIR